MQRMARPGRRSGPVVLLAEDNEDHREVYATYFRHRGLQVETATDGESAVSRALALVPDVIVMDLSMPRLDGWEASRRLKADRRTAHIPIVACTAHGFGHAVERALIAGCDAYVVKPCLPADLYAEVQRQLRLAARRRRA